MEYNENENQNLNDHDFFKKEHTQIKEKKNGNDVVWYVIIAILILGLLGWYGYTVGWFTRDTQDVTHKATGVDSSNKVKASISNVIIESSDDFPVHKTLVVSGNLPNGCTYLNDPQVVRDGSTFYVDLTTRKEGDTCTDALVPYTRKIDLEVLGLPAGVYTVVVNGIETSFELEQDNSIDFSTGEEK